MRQWLRCVWAVHTRAFSLLTDRLRVLWEQPWKVRLLLGAFLLPTLVVPLVWGLDKETVLLWPIFLTVQIVGVLRHPFQPRAGVIHPLPVWYFWLIQVIGVAEAGLLVWQATKAVQYGWVNEVQSYAVHLALLSLTTTLVPASLAYLEAIARCSRPSRLRVSAPTFYLVLLLVIWVSMLTYAFSVWSNADLAMVAILVLLPIPSVLLYKMPWSRSARPVAAVLPQLGLWLIVFAFVSELARFFGVMNPWFFLVGVVAEAVALLYWLFLRLRVSLAEELPEKTRDEALSVQTDPSRYVDTSGHGAQLLKFIRRSDGGVLGITGVRGAGKSALTAYVLSELEKSHFVLSMAAPIRPDPGLGFLSSVCRAVCRRILDNVQGALYGKRTQEGRARSEVLRRARNLAIVTVFLGIAALALVELVPEWLNEPARETVLSDPVPDFLLCYHLFEAERQITDQLLAQVQTALVEAAARSSANRRSLRYRLLPNLDGPGFMLLPESPGRVAPAPMGSLRGLYRNLVLQASHRDISGAKEPGKCNKFILPGYQMQAIRHFFESAGDPAAVEAPAQPPTASSANRLNKDYPDWLSVFLIEQYINNGGLLIDLNKLPDLSLLVKAYRQTLDGTPMWPVPMTRLGPVDQILRSIKAAWVLLPLSLLLLLVGGPAWRALSSLARAAMNWRYMALFREARQFLEQLNYSESLETKGGLSWKALSLERSRSLAARDLTLPGLTARYLEFVQSARGYYNGKLVIAIDELDKIHDPEMVKALLTEIKGALFAKGCYYLISISEDATRAFRQRLSSGRDIFESTFDDVIELSQMTAAVASAMIERRAETSPEEGRIPASCHFVLALAGGGIPREIVRHLRKISLAHEKDAGGLEPGPVAREILRAEVEAWEAGLAEAELSGEETIALRQEARAILKDLRGAGFSLPACGRVWERLEKCLGLIDPAKLRRTVVLLPDAAETDLPDAVRYRALVDDIQACLRLMILTTVCELAWRGDEGWKEHETVLLAAYRALADKPALAETLLGEVRAALGPEVCGGKKNPPPDLPRSLPHTLPGGEEPPPPAD